MTTPATCLPAMKADWVIGRSAVRHAPDQWSSALGEGTPEEQERGLVALAGQYAEVAVRPVLPDNTDQLCAIPVLSKPMLDENCRELFRLCLKHFSVPTEKLVHLIDAYGYTVHVADWGWPGSDRIPDCPETYLPWFQWIYTHGRIPWRYQELTEETWSKTWPPLRQAQLAAMRITEPGRARQLMVNHGHEVRSKERLSLLLKTFAINLTEDDHDYLFSVVNDHDGMVSQWAVWLLGRLGVAATSEDRLDKMRRLLTVSDGGHGGVIGVQQLSIVGESHQKQLGTMIRQGTLAELSIALEVTPDELVETWDLGGGVGGPFIVSVAQSASQDHVDVLCDRLLAEYSWNGKKDADLEFVFTGPLLERASTTTQRKVMSAFITQGLHRSLYDVRPGIAQWNDFRWESCVKISQARARDNKFIGPLAWVAPPELAQELLTQFSPKKLSQQDMAPLNLVVALGEASRSLVQELA